MINPVPLLIYLTLGSYVLADTVQPEFGWKELSKAKCYTTLNQYLIDNAAEDDFEAHNHAIRRYAIDLAMSHDTLTKSEKTIHQLLKSIQRLELMPQRARCSTWGQDVLATLDVLTGSRARLTPEPKLRIEWFVRQVFKRHAEICRYRLFEAYRSLLDKGVGSAMPMPIRDYLISVAQLLRDSKMEYFDSFKALQVKHKQPITLEAAKNFRDALYRAIEDPRERDHLMPRQRRTPLVIEQKVSDKKNKLDVDWIQIDRLLDKYLVKPCEDFRRDVSQLLGWIEFDLKVISPSTSFDYLRLLPREIHEGFSLFEACRYFEPQRKKIAKNVADYIREQIKAAEVLIS